MAGFFGELCRAWFGLTLFVTVLALGLCSHSLALVALTGALPKRLKEDLTVCSAVICFRVLLLCNPQIRVTYEGGAPTGEGAALLLMNHTSFMDFFLFTSALPLRTVLSRHVRTVVSSGLTKLPIIGRSMGSHAGSFLVYFQAKGSGFGKADDTDFSVDRDRQQVQTDAMDKHIEGGGAVAFCPEGGMNKTPPALNPFRRGSFGQAVKYRTPIWGAALVGCADCWPRAAAIGGYPATLGISFAMVLRPTEAQDAAAVADACRDGMQAQVDAFAARIQPKSKSN